MDDLGIKDTKNEKRQIVNMIIRRETPRRDESHTTLDLSTMSFKQNKELKRKSVNWKVWGRYSTSRTKQGGKGCWNPLSRGREEGKPGGADSNSRGRRPKLRPVQTSGLR